MNPAALLGIAEAGLAAFSEGGRAPHVVHWFRAPPPGSGAGVNHEDNVQALWGLYACYPKTMAAFRRRAQWSASFDKACAGPPAPPTLESLRAAAPALVWGALRAFQAQLLAARDFCACVLGDEDAGGDPAALARALCAAWDETVARAMDEGDVLMSAPQPLLGGDLVPPILAGLFAPLWRLHVHGFPPRPFPASFLPGGRRPALWGAGGASGGADATSATDGAASIRTLAQRPALVAVQPRATGVILLRPDGREATDADGRLLTSGTRGGGARKRARRAEAAARVLAGAEVALVASASTGSALVLGPEPTRLDPRLGPLLAPLAPEAAYGPRPPHADAYAGPWTAEGAAACPACCWVRARCGDCHGSIARPTFHPVGFLPGTTLPDMRECPALAAAAAAGRPILCYGDGLEGSHCDLSTLLPGLLHGALPPAAALPPPAAAPAAGGGRADGGGGGGVAPSGAGVQGPIGARPFHGGGPGRDPRIGGGLGPHLRGAGGGAGSGMGAVRPMAAPSVLTGASAAAARAALAALDAVRPPEWWALDVCYPCGTQYHGFNVLCVTCTMAEPAARTLPNTLVCTVCNLPFRIQCQNALGPLGCGSTDATPEPQVMSLDLVRDCSIIAALTARVGCAAAGSAVLAHRANRSHATKRDRDRVLFTKTCGLLEAMADPQSALRVGLLGLQNGFPVPRVPSGRATAPCTLAWRGDPRNPDLATLSPVSRLGLDIAPMDPCTLAIQPLCDLILGMLAPGDELIGWAGGPHLRARRETAAASGDDASLGAGAGARAAWEAAAEGADAAAGAERDRAAAGAAAEVGAACGDVTCDAVAAVEPPALVQAVAAAVAPALQAHVPVDAGPALVSTACALAGAPAVDLVSGVAQARADVEAALAHGLLEAEAAGAVPDTSVALAAPTGAVAAAMPGLDPPVIARRLAAGPVVVPLDPPRPAVAASARVRSEAEEQHLAGLVAAASRAMLHADTVGVAASARIRAYDRALAAGDVDEAQLRRLSHMAQQSALAKLEANDARNKAGDALKHARGLPGYEPLGEHATYATVASERPRRSGHGDDGEDAGHPRDDAGALHRPPPRHAPARPAVPLGDALAPGSCPPRQASGQPAASSGTAFGPDGSPTHDPPVRWVGPWAEHRDGRWSFRGAGARHVQGRNGVWLLCDRDGSWRRSEHGVNMWALNHCDRWVQCPGSGLPDVALPAWRATLAGASVAPVSRPQQLPRTGSSTSSAAAAAASGSKPKKASSAAARAASGPTTKHASSAAAVAVSGPKTKNASSAAAVAASGPKTKRQPKPFVPGHYGPAADPTPADPKRPRLGPTQDGPSASALFGGAMPAVMPGSGIDVPAADVAPTAAIEIASEGTADEPDGGAESDSSWSRRSRSRSRRSRHDDDFDVTDGFGSNGESSDDDGPNGLPRAAPVLPAPEPHGSSPGSATSEHVGIAGLDEGDYQFGDFEGLLEGAECDEDTDHGVPYSDYASIDAGADACGNAGAENEQCGESDSVPIGAPATTVTDDDLDDTTAHVRHFGAPACSMSDTDLDGRLGRARRGPLTATPLRGRTRTDWVRGLGSSLWSGVALPAWLWSRRPSPDVKPGGAPSVTVDDSDSDSSPGSGSDWGSSRTPMSSAPSTGDAADLSGTMSSPGHGGASSTADNCGEDSASDSMPGLVDETQRDVMPEGLCSLHVGTSAPGRFDAAWSRLGEVDLAWCGTVVRTAEYLGVRILTLLAELAPLVPHGATWQTVHDEVYRICDNAHTERTAAAATAAAARLVEAGTRHATFTADAAASVLVQSFAARLCAALDAADDAAFESAYLDALFAAALDAVSFHDTTRGSWWITFAPRIRAALDSASRRAGHHGFAARVDSIVGGGGLSCVHEWSRSGLAHPTAARDGRRASEPAWQAPGRPGDYYEELHRLAHDSRMGPGISSLATRDGDAAVRGHHDHATHVALLCTELTYHGACLVSGAGAVNVIRGASWSYLVEGAGRLARQRTWCAGVASGWRVDDAVPNAHADAASRGAVATTIRFPPAAHMPGRRASNLAPDVCADDLAPVLELVD